MNGDIYYIILIYIDIRVVIYDFSLLWFVVFVCLMFFGRGHYMYQVVCVIFGGGGGGRMVGWVSGFILA